MARYNNTITIGHGFNVNAENPIDSRMLVDYVIDLTQDFTWNKNITPLYNGMIVSVKENNSLWSLIDKNNYQSLNAWKRIDAPIIISGDDVETIY